MPVMAPTPCIQIESLSYSYGTRMALDAVSLNVAEGEVFGLLGPNGGGKTTLFRILSTLLPVTSGRVSVLGLDLKRQRHEIRSQISVIFQSPSLDKKLTVMENLRHQGHLYGLSGRRLAERIREMLERVHLGDRTHELVEQLSGGLQRRVEIAKSLLHQPRLLLLDEPTTGLDPAARKDLWDYLHDLRRREGTTLVFTTHLMEEAERCDRLGILDRGKLVAVDRPEALRARIGGEVLILRSTNPEDLCGRIRAKFGWNSSVLDTTVRFEHPKGHEFITRLVEAFPGQIDSITLSKPTLEDVFIQITGHPFSMEQADSGRAGK